MLRSLTQTKTQENKMTDEEFEEFAAIAMAYGEGDITLTNSESFALNQWLNDFPANMMYERIMERLDVPNEWSVEDITVWEIVENTTTEHVASLIRDTKRAYEMSVAEYIKENNQ